MDGLTWDRGITVVSMIISAAAAVAAISQACSASRSKQAAESARDIARSSEEEARAILTKVLGERARKIHYELLQRAEKLRVILVKSPDHLERKVRGASSALADIDLFAKDAGVALEDNEDIKAGQRKIESGLRDVSDAATRNQGVGSLKKGVELIRGTLEKMLADRAGA